MRRRQMMQAVMAAGLSTSQVRVLANTAMHIHGPPDSAMELRPLLLELSHLATELRGRLSTDSTVATDLVQTLSGIAQVCRSASRRTRSDDSETSMRRVAVVQAARDCIMACSNGLRRHPIEAAAVDTDIVMHRFLSAAARLQSLAG